MQFGYESTIAEPASARQLRYWDDYRLRDVTTTYAGPASPADTFTAPYDSAETAAATYPTLASVSTGSRVEYQSYNYDGRGNIITSTDDASDIYDRSLGNVYLGPNGPNPVSGPDQFGFSSESTGFGSILTGYDAAGNLTSIDNGETNTIYQYTWDELGRLATAVRLDSGAAQAQESFSYDRGGTRIRSTRQVGATGAAATFVDHDVAVFDSLVLKHAAFPGAPGDYERDAQTEELYLTVAGEALGHVIYDSGTLPITNGSNGRLHVLMSLNNRA